MDVRVVLVRPELPANVGAVARVIRNHGLAGLRLVRPGDWRTLECWRTAWGAQDVLEKAEVFDDLGAALAGCAVVYALSGRRVPGAGAVDVRDAAAHLAALDEGAGGCLVFGPEATGLTLHELAVCGRRATIPSHPDQPSLNLSHAVVVAAYEVFRAGRGALPPAPRGATHGEKAALLALLRAGLSNLGALPPDGAERRFAEWEALFHRVDLLPREVRLLEDAARKMSQARRGPRRSEEESGPA